jgi:hypothetical protein
MSQTFNKALFLFSFVLFDQQYLPAPAINTFVLPAARTGQVAFEFF